MSPTHGEPEAKRGVGLDTAADRRRPGRPANVSPELIPLLRGQVDPEAPPDPVLVRPGQPSFDRELVSGTLIVAALTFLGFLVRFAA